VVRVLQTRRRTARDTAVPLTLERDRPGPRRRCAHEFTPTKVRGMAIPTPAPSPEPVLLASSLEIAQFWVTVASTVATLIVAIVAVVVSVQAHRLNARVRQEAIDAAALADRRDFVREIDALRMEIIGYLINSVEMKKPALSLGSLHSRAIASGPGFVAVLGRWVALDRERREMTWEQNAVLAFVDRIAQLTTETSTWASTGKL